MTTTNITARIYDTDGSGDWHCIPLPRDGESLSDYGYRLQRYARASILDASDSYGDCDRVIDVDYEHQALVVVRAETDDEYVEYYLDGVVETMLEPNDDEAEELSRQFAEEGDAFARSEWEREL
jgi:hypothetical protein